LRYSGAMDDALAGKLHKLRGFLASLPSALVAYSGGVDSTLLALVSHQQLGENMMAVVVASPLLPPRELERAQHIAAFLGIPMVVVDADELSLPGFDHNPPDRCFLCKGYRLGILRDLAAREGWGAVLEGSNLDDAGAHRPGRRAVQELGVASPLEQAGMAKADVRALARELGLPNWDAPSRPCLATRFPYGTELRRESLARVDAAEEGLEAMGMRELRVRMDAPGEARIELGEDEMALLDLQVNRDRLVKKLRSLGFRRIALDLEGFRSGSMDESRTARSRMILYDEDDRKAGKGEEIAAAGTERQEE
jgi:pyridinium-3,5-biscarboxylic acid mononucleotide sulfurtransferase